MLMARTISNAIPPVMASASGTMGNGQPISSAQTAASSWPVGIPGRLAARCARRARIGSGHGGACGFSGEDNRDARAGGDEHGLEGVQERGIAAGKLEGELIGAGHPGDLLERMHRRGLVIV
jgi:hypothetical protein